MEVSIFHPRSCLLFVFVLSSLLLIVGCSSAPPPSPALAATQPAQPSPEPTQAPTETIAPPSPTPNALGLVIVAQLDPTRQVLTIYGVTPGATVVMGGTPLPLPPSPTPTFTPSPTLTPPPTLTPSITPTHAPHPPTATPISYSRQGLFGKILFKSTRNGGTFTRPNWFIMNPDGSNIQQLQNEPAEQFAISLESQAYGIENMEPGGKRRVFGERRCPGVGTCLLYILDTELDASLINSTEDISKGQWFGSRNFVAKDPVWSPTGQYIAFVSNHDPRDDCVRKSLNVFKATPNQNPVVRRLTDLCSGGNVGHPSFGPDGGQLVFFADTDGVRQIYVVDVGSDDNFDFTQAQERKITDGQAHDWDPVWIK